MIASRRSVVLMAAIAGCIAMHPSHLRAQWWSHAPADFEECADTAEKQSTKETKASALKECNAKFAGRRKPGGGYTYYDFMQDRKFDIAGPNPTAEERKQIDRAYMSFLDAQQREAVSAELAKRNNERLRASLESARQQAAPPIA